VLAAGKLGVVDLDLAACDGRGGAEVQYIYPVGTWLTRALSSGSSSLPVSL
jgi:hypothetical protein